MHTHKPSTRERKAEIRPGMHMNNTLSTILQPRRQLVYLADLLREMVMREIKLRYKRSVLGIGWSLLNPFVQMLVFTVLFGRWLQLDIPNYPQFVFIGVLAWTWFQASLIISASAITDNRELIKRPGFPAHMLPIITVTTQMVQFLLAMPVLLAFIVFTGGTLNPGALVFLPLVITLQFLFSLSLGYLAATFHVTFRDTQHLLTVFTMFYFYMTPVFYDASFVPGALRDIYRLNPLYILITAYRDIFIEGQVPNLGALLILGAIAAALLWVGRAVFMRASYRFVEEL